MQGVISIYPKKGIFMTNERAKDAPGTKIYQHNDEEHIFECVRLSSYEELEAKLEALQLTFVKVNHMLAKKDQQLAIAVEALKKIKGDGHSSDCEIMKPYRPNYRCAFEEADEALQKLGVD